MKRLLTEKLTIAVEILFAFVTVAELWFIELVMAFRRHLVEHGFNGVQLLSCDGASILRVVKQGMPTKGSYNFGANKMVRTESKEAKLGPSSSPDNRTSKCPPSRSNVLLDRSQEA